jgi:putative oxidoreductase
MKAFFETDKSWTGLILRVTLGLVMFPHGAQKLLGWYGGSGSRGRWGSSRRRRGSRGSSPC